MTHGLTHIPFEEFSRNPGAVLERVVRKKERVIVQTAAGEPALLQPIRPATKHSPRKTQADYEAFRASAGGWKDVDVEVFLKDIRASRRLNTRPPVQL